MKALLDTVILIDYLNGHEQAETLLDRHEDIAISVITWIEVMAGVTSKDESVVRSFLKNLRVVPVSPQIAERAATIRRTHQPRLKLPDAIILATAHELSYVLMTRNTRDFPEVEASVVIPYQL